MFRLKTRQLLVNTPQFYIDLVLGFFGLLFLRWIAPSVFPYKLFQFWNFHWDWEKFANIPWFLLLFGPLLSIGIAIFTKKERYENLETKYSFSEDIKNSAKAGVFEELAFRWLLFQVAIFTFAFDQFLINWLNGMGFISAILSWHWFWILVSALLINALAVFGFIIAANSNNGWLTLLGILMVVPAILLDLAIILLFSKWWYTGVLFPITNFATLGKLGSIFEMVWTVPAAMISVNWKFSSGHIYQGPIGWIHSWVMGMLMFWLMFNFGLFAAMLVHALFDMTLNVIAYLNAEFELRFGR